MTQQLIEASGGILKHMRVTDILERVQLIQEVLEKVMKEGTHYGASFPGDEKKNLLKPGAELIGVTFQLYPEFEIEEQAFEAWHRNYNVKAIIKHQVTGQVVGQGVGSCSTLESKYRYRKMSRVCPTCGKEAIIDSTNFQTKRPDGFICWKNHKKNPGCGAKFTLVDKRITDQELGRKENEDPADLWNTAKKIAKKRAFVDGMITATGCSDMFTQDAEDIAENYEAQKRKDEAAAPAPAPAPQASAPKASPPQTPPPAAPASVRSEEGADAERQSVAGEDDQRPPDEKKADAAVAGGTYLESYRKQAGEAKTRGELNQSWDAFASLVDSSPRLDPKEKAILKDAGWAIKKAEVDRIVAGK